MLHTETSTDSESNFLEEPSSINVALGDEAVFRCRHAAAEIIGWDINGTSLGRFHPLNISSSSVSDSTNDALLHTLTVAALEAYNNTNVSCVAIFFDSQILTEQTPNATLVVQGVYATYYHVGMCGM